MKKTNTTQVRGEQVSDQNARQIKLSIDVHAENFRVVRQVDGASPQPGQKFSPAGFLVWAAKQQTLADEVYSCYEAGPFGYGLHRKLLAMGIKNIVIRPQNWDEFGKGVKTDSTDAMAMAHRLDQYVSGNLKALAIVHVPSIEEERARAVSRHRDQIRKERQRLEAQGRSLLLYNGVRLKGRWWRRANWQKLSERQLGREVYGILETTRQLISVVDQKLREVTASIEAKAPAQPKGFGALTTEIIDREIGSWDRFKNRRGIASLTGMCPSIYASGQKMLRGSITKHGNPRLRRALIELAWRVVRFQPTYGPVVKWRTLLAHGSVTSSAKKKAIVAIGRKLIIDLWRLHTGRSTPEALGLQFAA